MTQLAAQLATVGATVDVEGNELVIKIPIVEQLKATLRAATQQLMMQYGLTMNVTDVSVIDQSKIRIILETDVTSLLLSLRNRLGMLGNVEFKDGQIMTRIRLPKNITL